MSLPTGATHKWYDPKGAFRAFLMVSDWVYYYDERYGWVAVGKSIENLSGTTEAL